MSRRAVHIYAADGTTFLGGWVTEEGLGEIISQALTTYGDEIQIEVQDAPDATGTGLSQAAG